MNEPTTEAIEKLETSNLPKQDEANPENATIEATQPLDIPEQLEQAVKNQNTASDEQSDTAATQQIDNPDDEVKLLEAKYYALSKEIDESKLEDILKIAKTKVSDKITMEQAIDLTLERYPIF